MAEYDPTGAEIRSYGYRPDATWTTDPLWLQQNGQYYFYHNDHLGTPQKLVAQNGAVVWSASYTAFGQATVGVETITNNLRFPGQYEDAETGLHYNYFRYYEPIVGRYGRTDPVGLKKRDNHHLFIYVNNNPIMNIDTAGLTTQSCIKKVSSSRVWSKESGYFFYCDWLNQLAHNIAKFGEGENHKIGTNPPCLLCWKVTCPPGYSLRGTPQHRDICLPSKDNLSPMRLSTIGQPVEGWQTRDPNIYVPAPYKDVDYCVAVTTTANWSNSKFTLHTCIRMSYECCREECQDKQP